MASSQTDPSSSQHEPTAMQKPPQTAEPGMIQLPGPFADEDGFDIDLHIIESMIHTGIMQPIRFTAEEKRKIEQELEEKAVKEARLRQLQRERELEGKRSSSHDDTPRES